MNRELRPIKDSIQEMKTEMETMKQSILTIQMQLTGIYAEPAPLVKCTTFMPDGLTTSATKCKFCGREKWDHFNGIH